ncbi:hypothetical protein M0R45_002152 [Rubus argutus]|uniref:RNase H type-1 domain-containing protein n=1 Tax=Rubus argutus TaxID=59490 RepID=A0AAW1VKC0_RUBAR
MVGVLEEKESGSEQSWTLFFDGSATSNGGGAGVVLTDPVGNTKALSFKLRFSCTNNIAEYEAFIIGMSTAVEMGVKRINVIGDSNLVISQMKGDFAKTKPSTEALILHEVPEKDDWRSSIKNNLTSRGNEINLKTLKDYIILHEELYMRLPGGILARCICDREAKQRLHEVHKATCGLEQVIISCPKCSVLPSEEEVFTVETTEDWRTPYLMFLLNNTLPTDARCRYKLKKSSKTYFIDGEVLYRKGFNGEPLRCLDNVESLQVLNEVHTGECGEHQGKRKLYQQVLSLGYYWPTMRKMLT